MTSAASPIGNFLFMLQSCPKKAGATVKFLRETGSARDRFIWIHRDLANTSGVQLLPAGHLAPFPDAVTSGTTIFTLLAGKARSTQRDPSSLSSRPGLAALAGLAETDP